MSSSRKHPNPVPSLPQPACFHFASTAGLRSLFIAELGMNGRVLPKAAVAHPSEPRGEGFAGPAELRIRGGVVGGVRAGGKGLWRSWGWGSEPRRDSVWGRFGELGGTCRRGEAGMDVVGCTSPVVGHILPTPSAEEAWAGKGTGSLSCWRLRGSKGGKDTDTGTWWHREGTSCAAGPGSKGEGSGLARLGEVFQEPKALLAEHKHRTHRQGPCFEGSGGCGQKRPRGAQPGVPSRIRRQGEKG